MTELIKLFQENGDRLVKATLSFVKKNDFTKNISVIEETWRRSINGLISLLSEELRDTNPLPGFSPAKNTVKNPFDLFGIGEAKKYKPTGISLNQLLIMFKYIRQACAEVITDFSPPEKTARLLITFERSFDRIEIGLCEEWTRLDKEGSSAGHKAAKISAPFVGNHYQQIFQNYNEPVIVINEKNEILNINIAAVKMIKKEQPAGSRYSHQQTSRSTPGGPEQDLRPDMTGKKILTVIPWLKTPLNELQKQKKSNPRMEYCTEQKGERKFYEINYSGIPEPGGKDGTGIVILRDMSDLKKTQKALSDSEAKISSIIRVAPVGIGVEVDRVIENVNDRFCEITGYSRDEIINKQSRFLFPDQVEFERIGKVKYNQFIKSGYCKILTRLLRKDGKIIDVLIFSTPIDNNDLSLGITFTALDITEEKHTQEALQTSQKMMRSILNTIPVRVFWKNLDSVYIGSNLLFAQDAGFDSPEEIIGKKDIHMAWRSDVEKYNEIDREVIETGKAKRIFEDPRIMPDGNIRWFKTNKIPLRDQKGDIWGILGCYEDITEHKKTVEALRENEARYRSLFEDSPISLWEEDFSKVKKIIDNLTANGVTDLDGYLKNHPEIIKSCIKAIQVLNINQATMNIYKSHDKNELCANLENIFSEDAYKMMHKELAAFARGETRYIDETVQYNIKGEDIWSEVQVIIAPGYEKNWAKVFVSMIDITERKHVEKALRESEQRYRLFFENSHDGIIIIKGDELSDCNPKILEIFNCRKEQIIGNKLYNLSPVNQPDGKSSKEKTLELIKAVQAGSAQVFEWVFARPDNDKFTAEVSLTPFVLENQNLILAIIRDITDRIQVEKTLRLTQFSIDHSGEAVYMMGPDAHFVYANDTACRYLGYTKEELLSMTVFDIDPNFNLRKWKPHWEEIEKRKSFTLESIHKKKNGEYLPVEITVNYVVFMGKEYNCAFGRDISERKRAEKALRESEKKYRTLFETMKQGVIYQNDKGEIISANPAAETILGLSREQLYGLSSNTTNWEAVREDGSVFPGDTHPAMVALKTGKEIKNVVMGVFNQKDNGYRWININAIPQFDEYNKPIQVYSTFSDITERKLTEDKLRNYAQTQQVLLQEVNHRVKNNLAAIISMLHKEEDRAASKGYTNHLPVLQNLETRVNGLLTVHSILSSIKWQPVELSQLCDKVISNALQASPHYKNITLDVEESTVKINSNVAHYLTIVLNELATNSLKYALQVRETVKIRVYFKESKKYTILYYQDDGPGFPDKILKDHKNESNIGFELIHGIIYHSLNGKLELYNDDGAAVKLFFVNDTEFQHEDL